jgi:hypothetical protein
MKKVTQFYIRTWNWWYRSDIASSTNSKCSRNWKFRHPEWKFVRPSLEYASTVWDPHTQANINKVESIQRRAARFVTNNYDPRASVTTLLQDLNWPTLQHRRQLAKLIMMYRITYHLIEIPSITYLIPSRSGTRGHNIRYLQPSTRVLAYQYSFFPSTIRLWNNLPQTLVSSGSIDTFRHSLTNTSLP